jgi:Leucine-rich repeat (LRR) protein
MSGGTMMYEDSMVRVASGSGDSMAHTSTAATEAGEDETVDEWLSVGDVPALQELREALAVHAGSCATRLDTAELDDEGDEASAAFNFFKSVSYAEPFVPIRPPPGIPPPGILLGSKVEAPPPAGLVPPTRLASKMQLQEPKGSPLRGEARPFESKMQMPLNGLARPFCPAPNFYQKNFAREAALQSALQFSSTNFASLQIASAHSLELQAALCRSTANYMDTQKQKLVEFRAEKKEAEKQRQSDTKKKKAATKGGSDKVVKFKNQKTLDFRARKLRSLPEMGNLDSVQSLILSRNKLPSLPESFGQLQALQLLNLSHNFELTSLPDSFGQLKSLQTLLLHDNKLSALPENFGELQSLQILYLQSNKLARLPDSFAKLKALEILDLRRNVLSSLPEDFGQLIALQTLSLQYNRLSSLPRTFCQLHNLKEVNLWSNPLPRSALPETIGELCELQPLKFGHPSSI